MGTTTAVMLMGFVAFMMALFYLVNYHDEDIKFYTWVICSVTVSIFIAVLLFSAICEFIGFFLPDSLLREFLQFLTLWSITQLILIVYREGHGKRSASQGKLLGAEAEPFEAGGESNEEEDIPNVPLKAFGTLMAHITGFAGIRSFELLQMQPDMYFSTSWYAGMLVIPIFAVVAITLAYGSEIVRKLATKTKEEEGEEVWQDQCAETEDDIICLTFSALTCVCIRFAISGEIPSAHGNFEGRHWKQVICLMLAGFGCLVLVVLVTWKKKTVVDQAERSATMRKWFDAERAIDVMQITAGLTMSWCFYFGTQWGFYVYLREKEGMKGVAGKLIMAVLVSFVTMLAIFMLDAVGDGSPAWKKALNGVITALGLLVGISWEGAFAMGVDEIAVNWHHDAEVLVVKLLLALGLVAVVLPAWKLYILPKSDPAIMKYYRGKNPPLKALCSAWDPQEEYLCKSEQHRRRRSTSLPKDGATTAAARTLVQ